MDSRREVRGGHHVYHGWDAGLWLVFGRRCISYRLHMFVFVHIVVLVGMGLGVALLLFLSGEYFKAVRALNAARRERLAGTAWTGAGERAKPMDEAKR